MSLCLNNQATSGYKKQIRTSLNGLYKETHSVHRKLHKRRWPWR